MTSGGTALVCGPSGAGSLHLPATCSSTACRQARDEAAIERAIAAGVIDR